MSDTEILNWIEDNCDISFPYHGGGTWSRFSSDFPGIRVAIQYHKDSKPAVSSHDKMLIAFPNLRGDDK